MPPTDPPGQRRRSAVAAIALSLVLLAAACGPQAPSASPSEPASLPPTPIGSVAAPTASPSAGAPSPISSADEAAALDKVESQVVAIRGLQPKRPVARQFIDQAELRTLLTQMFDQDTPPAYEAGTERLYRALGLIAADANLRTLSLDLLSGGVAAFYRSDQAKLYVVTKSGGVGPVERFYFSHEYDHALQDQNSTIFKDFDKVIDQSDELLARQSIYEGDATLLMTQWAAANLDPSELLQLLAAGTDPVAQAAMAAAPPFMRETLTFPYTVGLSYVTNVQSTGGWPAVTAYFSKMPRSTEQIMHPEKYVAGEAPIPVSLPADLATRLGAGWTVQMQDTFGEFQLGTWLRESGVVAADATTAAAGWGGDRLAVLAGPGGAWAVAIDTEWDTAPDATEFDAAAKVAIEKAVGTAQVLAGAGAKSRWILVADQPATLNRLEAALGLGG
jgi:hypothetical protein